MQHTSQVATRNNNLAAEMMHMKEVHQEELDAKAAEVAGLRVRRPVHYLSAGLPGYQCTHWCPSS